MILRPRFSNLKFEQLITGLTGIANLHDRCTCDVGARNLALLTNSCVQWYCISYVALKIKRLSMSKTL